MQSSPLPTDAPIAWERDNTPPEPLTVDETLTARGTQYGDYANGAKIAQSILDVFNGSPNWAMMEPYKKNALNMCAQKVSRILNGDSNHVDSWLDIAGYSQLVVAILERNGEEA